MIRHAWLQKHATPTAADGAFHWHPADGDRELRARFVERARGLEPPAVLWELAPGRVIWAQVFAVIAPHDRRRYTGLVLTIVERPGAAIASLLEALALPPAAPRDDDAGDAVSSVRELPAGLCPAELVPLARSLLGGAAVCDALTPAVFAALPAAVRAIERAVPATARGCRTWSAVARDVASAAADDGDRIAWLVARACLAPGSRAAWAWTMVCELAAHAGGGVDAVGAEVWPEREREELASVLHAWGRDRDDADVEAGASAASVRCADTLAVRIIECLDADRDPSPVVAAARWHALLPADRRARLFELAVRRCPSLHSLLGTGRGDARA